MNKSEPQYAELVKISQGLVSVLRTMDDPYLSITFDEDSRDALMIIRWPGGAGVDALLEYKTTEDE